MCYALLFLVIMIVIDYYEFHLCLITLFPLSLHQMQICEYPSDQMLLLFLQIQILHSKLTLLQSLLCPRITGLGRSNFGPLVGLLNIDSFVCSKISRKFLSYFWNTCLPRGFNSHYPCMSLFLSAPLSLTISETIY